MRVCQHAVKMIVLLPMASMLSSSAAEASTDAKACKIIDCAHPNLFLAPYVWKRLQTKSTVQVEATMPGAYLKAAVQGTS